MPYRLLVATFIATLFQNVASPAAALGQELQVSPGIEGAAAAADRLRSLNGALREFLLDRSEQKTVRLTREQSLLRVDRINTQIRVGNGIGPIIDSPLLNDPAYKANLRSLAALEATARDATPQPRSAVPVDTGETPRIWGVAARLLSQRFTVAVQTLNQAGLCSGVLVGEDQVLTALHCLCEGPAHDITHIDYVDGQDRRLSVPVRSIKTFYRDPPADPANQCKSPDGPGGTWPETGGLPPGEDVILLQLERPVEADAAAPLTYFATKAQRETASAVVVAGFGHSEAHDIERRALGTMVALAGNCSAPQPGAALPCALDAEFVAGPKPLSIPNAPSDNDTCDGDSGGPALIVSKNSIAAILKDLQVRDAADAAARREAILAAMLDRGQFVLAGITSRGLTATCGQGGIYTDLSAPRIQQRLRDLGVPLLTSSTFTPF